MDESVHIVCPHCDAINRVLRNKLADTPKCGSCKQMLFNAHPVELTSANFDRHVGRSGIPVVVDFWASWCGPCKMMAPAFEQAARLLEPRMRLAKLNTEKEQAIAARFGIQSIPTLAVFKEGREVARQSGAMDAATLVAWVESHT